jgi:hypothetical protein
MMIVYKYNYHNIAKKWTVDGSDGFNAGVIGEQSGRVLTRLLNAQAQRIAELEADNERLRASIRNVVDNLSNNIDEPLIDVWYVEVTLRVLKSAIEDEQALLDGTDESTAPASVESSEDSDQ